MPKYYFFIFLFLTPTLFSCSQEKTTKESPIRVETSIVAEPVYERLPLDLGNLILTQSNALEGTFYNSGKSISLWDDNVKSILAMMTESAPLKLDNNVIGHIMYLKDGEQLAFVEISMKGGNNYVIYNINDKKYYNTFNEQGLKFFNQMASPTIAPAAPK